MGLRILEHNKFLWWFAGEDPFILTECNKEVRVKFSLIGLFVVVVMVITFISISYGVYHLLESYEIGFMIGVYSAFLIMFLYMFVLYTLTKDVLPYKKKKKVEVSISYVIRFGFLFALGLVVSQPIEYHLFSNEVDNLLSLRIEQSIIEKNKSLNKDYAFKVKELRDLNLSPIELNNEIDRFKVGKERILDRFSEYQYSRNFFIEKMILMDKHLVYIWGFSVLFVILFIAPIYLKLKIDLNSNYYKNKRTIQRALLENHYHRFIETYNSILKEKFPKECLVYKSVYQDSPYNIQKVSKPELETEEDFTKWLLNEGN